MCRELGDEGRDKGLVRVRGARALKRWGEVVGGSSGENHLASRTLPCLLMRRIKLICDRFGRKVIRRWLCS